MSGGVIAESVILPVAAGGAPREPASPKLTYMLSAAMPNARLGILGMFFPCYNDGKTIGDLVVRRPSVSCSRLTDDYEIIVVNDGSTRRQRRRPARAGARGSRGCESSRTRRNRGYGGALRSGFAHATKELVFYTDGDGQYDVGELPVLLMLLTDDTDFVNGIKMTRQDPPHRVFVGNLHRFLMRWSFWLPISDVDCDFRLIRRCDSSSASSCAATAARSASSW